VTHPVVPLRPVRELRPVAGLRQGGLSPSTAYRWSPSRPRPEPSRRPHRLCLDQALPRPGDPGQPRQPPQEQEQVQEAARPPRRPGHRTQPGNPKPDQVYRSRRTRRRGGPPRKDRDKPTRCSFDSWPRVPFPSIPEPPGTLKAELGRQPSRASRIAWMSSVIMTTAYVPWKGVHTRSGSPQPLAPTCH
jgi:hypothetical protein